MSQKSFELSKDDPLVREFEAGIKAWEQPLAEPETGSGESAPIRTRGAVRTRGGPRPHTPSEPPDFALPEDDLLVERYDAGLEDWERPFEQGGEDG